MALLREQQAKHAPNAEDSAELEFVEMPGESEGVEEAADLRSVERLLANLQKPQADPFQLPRRRSSRPQVACGTPLHAWALQPLPGIPGKGERSGLLAWLFLGVGLMAFACGGVMLGWGAATERAELWELGIPLTLSGQAAMIFGLLGLLENAGQRHKQTAAALEEHRQRLLMMQNLALASGTGGRKAG